MHRIHVRTAVIDLPPVRKHDIHPTHDEFVIPTGPNETIVELSMLELGAVPGGFPNVLHRFRFRAVSVEPVDGPQDSDVVIEYEDIENTLRPALEQPVDPS